MKSRTDRHSAGRQRLFQENVPTPLVDMPMEFNSRASICFACYDGSRVCRVFHAPRWLISHKQSVNKLIWIPPPADERRHISQLDLKWLPESGGKISLNRRF